MEQKVRDLGHKDVNIHDMPSGTLRISVARKVCPMHPHLDWTSEHHQEQERLNPPNHQMNGGLHKPYMASRKLVRRRAMGCKLCHR